MCPPAMLSMVAFRIARHFEGEYADRVFGEREPFPADDVFSDPSAGQPIVKYSE